MRELDGLAELGDGRVRPPHRKQREPEPPVRPGEILVHFERVAEIREGLVVAPRVVEDEPGSGVAFEGERIERTPEFDLANGFVESAHPSEKDRKRPMAVGVVRAEAEGLSISALGRRPIVIEDEAVPGQRGVRLRNRGIELHGAPRGRSRGGKRLPRREKVVGGAREPLVSDRDAGVREGVIRLLRDRLLEVVEGLARVGSSGLRHVKLALQVRIVGPRIDDLPTREAAALLLGQPHPDLPGDRAGHLSLERQDVLDVALEGVGPEVAILRRVDQLRGDLTREPA